jgi:hypothetical protein
VGIQFTADQEKQIKALQESGDLLGAQNIILKELGTEFGGRFAAQGKTARGTIAGIGDAVEDLQKSLATALFPTVQKLLPRFRELLGSPQFASAVSNLGNKIADLFSDANIAEGSRALEGLFKVAKEAAPALQAAAEVTGKVIKTSVDLFRSLPKELQSLAIAGLAVNKLTGGLVTNIAGGLISAVISSFKGLMNVNAAVVNVNGPVAGIPGAAQAAGAGALATGAAALTGAGLVIAIKESGLLAEVKHGFNELIFGKDRADAIAAAELGFGKPGSPAITAAAARLGQFGPPNQVPLGPPTTVSGRNAINAQIRAMTQLTGATKANTSATILAGRTIGELRQQEKAARGNQFRIGFVARGKPSDTLPVADYLTRQFAVSQAPFYRNMDNAKRALEAIKADQRRAIRLGDFGTARKLGKDIDSLQATIKANKPVVTVTVPITTSINGRVVGAAISRFTSTVGNLRLSGYGGTVG